MIKPVHIPKDILQWLEHNKYCAHHDLQNSLLEAGHPVKNCVAWVKTYFGDNFSPSYENLKDELKAVIDSDEPNQPSVKADPSAVLVNAKPAQHFVPEHDFGPYFPNALMSRDLGVHPISLNCAKPRILQVMNVLTSEECDQLIMGSRKNLTRSTVVSNSAEGGFSELHDTRTSYGSFYNRGCSELIRRVEKRLSEIFRFPVSHGESIQILNYGVGGEYKPHFDYFDPETEGGKAAMKKGGNRVATIIMYLNNVDLGGATLFPEGNMQIMPIRGSAVYFDYRLPDGTSDPLTLHGGAPVQQGEKWIATKWVRELPWS